MQDYITLPATLCCAIVEFYCHTRVQYMLLFLVDLEQPYYTHINMQTHICCNDFHLACVITRPCLMIVAGNFEEFEVTKIDSHEP